MAENDGLTVCRECGANEDVHRGVCRRCRHLDRGRGVLRRDKAAARPREPQLEPLHSPPWVHRGGG